MEDAQTFSLLEACNQRILDNAHLSNKTVREILLKTLWSKTVTSRAEQLGQGLDFIWPRVVNLEFMLLLTQWFSTLDIHQKIGIQGPSKHIGHKIENLCLLLLKRIVNYNVKCQDDLIWHEKRSQNVLNI